MSLISLNLCALTIRINFEFESIVGNRYRATMSIVFVTNKHVAVSVAALHLVSLASDCIRLVLYAHVQVYSIVCLAVRISSARDSLHFSVTWRPQEAVPYLIFHSDVSAGAILDILTVLMAVLVLVAIVKKWAHVILSWIYYTLFKNTVDVVISLSFCRWINSTVTDNKTTVCVIGSPTAIFLCVISAISMVAVYASLEYPDGTARLPSQDRRTAVDSTDGPPTYSFVVRHTRSSVTDSDIDIIETLPESEAVPPCNSPNV